MTRHKNVNILEFGYYIWNPYEKCIQKSPNMPGIGSLIIEIEVKIVRNLIKANKLLLIKTSSRVLSVKERPHHRYQLFMRDQIKPCLLLQT